MERAYEWLLLQPSWRASGGSDHHIIFTHKQCLTHRLGEPAVRQQLTANAIFVTAEDRESRAEVRRGCTALVYPYFVNVSLWTAGRTAPKGGEGVVGGLRPRK